MEERGRLYIVPVTCAQNAHWINPDATVHKVKQRGKIQGHSNIGVISLSISFCCVQLSTEYNIKQCYSCCAQKNNTKSLKKVFQPCRRPRPFLYNGLLISLITSFYSYLRRQVCGPSADSNSSGMHCQSVIINIRSTGYLD